MSSSSLIQQLYLLCLILPVVAGNGSVGGGGGGGSIGSIGSMRSITSNRIRMSSEGHSSTSQSSQSSQSSISNTSLSRRDRNRNALSTYSNRVNKRSGIPHSVRQVNQNVPSKVHLSESIHQSHQQQQSASSSSSSSSSPSSLNPLWKPMSHLSQFSKSIQSNIQSNIKNIQHHHILDRRKGSTTSTTATCTETTNGTFCKSIFHHFRHILDNPSFPSLNVHRGGGGGGGVGVAVQTSTPTSNKQSKITSVSTKAKKPQRRKKNNTGFYYGIREDVFFPDNNNEEDGGDTTTSKTESQSKKEEDYSSSNNNNKNRSNNNNNEDTASTLADIMGETLLELREMREDISVLREEILDMKQEMQHQQQQPPPRNEPDSSYNEHENDGSSSSTQYEDYEYGVSPYQNQQSQSQPQQNRKKSFVSRLKRQREYDAIAADVESWAKELLFSPNHQGESSGWKEVKCNKMVRNKFNEDGNIQCFIKWMKDSRGKHANVDDGDKEYPCIKCYATINASFDDVCDYLADESRVPEYNDLVISHRDLEDITPYSKICWSQCPQILFIKSRDFCTYCHHRWRKDGTQIVINQACEHVDAPGNDEDTDGKICRALALRGANFISPDPEDNTRTRFALLAHADPGGGIPQWAMKTAVNAVAPIEPFKLFHRIEARVNAASEQSRDYDSIGRVDSASSTSNDSSSTLPNDEKEAEMCSMTPGVGGIPSTTRSSNRPGGLSQMGYACFWPKGGGLIKE